MCMHIYMYIIYIYIYISEGLKTSLGVFALNVQPLCCSFLPWKFDPPKEETCRKSPNTAPANPQPLLRRATCAY